MAQRWDRDPWRRNEYRWFNGKSWTDQVANGGRVSVDPPTINGRYPTPPPYVPERGRTMPQPVTPPQPVGVIGSVAAAGAGYAVLVYLGIPSILIMTVAPPLGLVLLGLTVFLAFRSGRSVGRATQRGVTVVSAHIEDAFAEFMSGYRAYQSNWGEWTPPGSPGDNDKYFDGGENDQSQFFGDRGDNDQFFGDRGYTTATADATPSPFATLRIPERASLHEAQAAYHRLARQLHPDRNMDKTVVERARMEDQLKVVTDAYNAIKEQYRYTTVG